MHKYIQPVNKAFEQNAHAENAASAKAYLLNQFEFFGLKTPLRDSITKAYLKQSLAMDINEVETIVKELWSQPQREHQYFAIDVFAAHKKLWTPSSLKLIEYCITNKSWWDSVDGIASDWLGPFFKLFPNKISATKKWNESTNMWLQRSSIMFQKAYKKDTDTALLSAYILNCKDSKEFFIQKAIGWALREYSKTNPEWVKKFVANNELAPLSKREALKRIENGKLTIENEGE
jgi:3-methyladenine DNA glycosylase AlkD